MDEKLHNVRWQGLRRLHLVLLAADLCTVLAGTAHGASAGSADAVADAVASLMWVLLQCCCAGAAADL